VADPTQDYGEDARQRAARAGHALPDGSYPMRTCREVHDAAQAYGRAPASHRGQLRALHNRRNSELGCGGEEL
jgi:hypothetical protein